MKVTLSSSFEPSEYGPVLAPLIESAGEQPIDDSAGVGDVLKDIKALTVENAFRHIRLHDHALGACCVAGVCLLHGHLDKAHSLCQDVDLPSGSYWHGIVHRREGDYGNSKYWFSRAGDHPASDLIAVEAAAHSPSAHLGARGSWDAEGFVDFCREALSGNDKKLIEVGVSIQAVEWRCLFDWCFHNAT